MSKNEWLLKSAAIAAMYAVLTWFIPAFSYGAIQFRVSEVMTLLAFYNPAYIPGLVAGCAIANIVSPFGIFDILFGSLASFLALKSMTYTKNIYIASLFPALFSFIIGLEILLLSSEPVNFLLVTGQIMLSELIIVSVIGIPFFKMLEQNPGMKRLITTMELPHKLQ